jgi:hypothetical protein
MISLNVEASLPLSVDDFTDVGLSLSVDASEPVDGYESASSLPPLSKTVVEVYHRQNKEIPSFFVRAHVDVSQLSNGFAVNSGRLATTRAHVDSHDIDLHSF